MILAVIDNAKTDENSLIRAVADIEEITDVHYMTIDESFDKLAIFSPDEPVVSPDIVLVNFAAHTNAFEIALAIKCDEKYLDTVIIGFNVPKEHDLKHTLLETGCFDYIKDFTDETEIFARLRSAASHREEIISRHIRETEIEESNKKLQDIVNKKI